MPGATAYRLYLANDRNMTSPITGYAGLPVYNTVFQPNGSFPDRQAGPAIFWEVVPCYSSINDCNGIGPAEHSFEKLSNSPELVSPVSPVPPTPAWCPTTAPSRTRPRAR